MEYTKGEWTAGTEDIERGHPIFCGDELVATAWFVEDNESKGYQEANARLIAKSPRMYELLEEITTTELNAETLYILQPWLNKVMAILEDTP